MPLRANASNWLRRFRSADDGFLVQNVRDLGLGE
jgi:hypothetical protein